MTNKQGILLLAFCFAATPAFADSTSSHSKGANASVSFSEGFFSQQDSSRNSAQCNFLFGAPKENGLSTTSITGSPSGVFAKGEKGSEFGGRVSNDSSVKLVDFSGNNGASSDKDKGKSRGKQGGGSGDGNGTTSGNGDPSLLIAVSEPGSRSLLLFGLAGIGMLFYRGKTLPKAT